MKKYRNRDFTYHHMCKNNVWKKYMVTVSDGQRIWSYKEELNGITEENCNSIENSLTEYLNGKKCYVINILPLEN